MRSPKSRQSASRCCQKSPYHKAGRPASGSNSPAPCIPAYSGDAYRLYYTTKSFTTESTALIPHIAYALGIGVPPDWVGSFFAAPREGVPDQPLQAGMVFNYENQFDVWENWPGGSGAAYIETVLVTESKLEVLSALPRDLVVV